MIDSKATGEFEWELDVAFRLRFRVMHENGKKLVVSYGVEGKKRVGDKIYNTLTREDF